MLSLIIPTYGNSDELKRELPSFLSFLKESGLETELIIVDDGSEEREKSRSVAENFKAKFLYNENNLGKGAAIRKGILASEGEKIIFTDADIPFDYKAIPAIWKLLDEYDVVTGDRNLYESEYHENTGKVRSFASGLYTFIIGRFLTKGLYDTQCGLKGFRRDVALDLFSSGKLEGFAFDVEVLYLTLKRKYRLYRIPVKLRNHGESTVRVWKHAPGMLVDLIRIKVNDLFGRY